MNSRGGAAALALVIVAGSFGCGARPALPETEYPWHTDIPATTFWVGEVFDASAPDGSQRVSTYDSDWLGTYGGCDGREVRSRSGGTSCRTERRTAKNGFFPLSMTPRENPFYLSLPFDDVHDQQAFAMRGSVIPWAQHPQYRDHVDDPSRSLMKNRWVVLHRHGRVCYGQIQDAGPGVYDDAEYVFGSEDARPANRRYGGSGLDVSPALNACLGFSELDGQGDRLDWAFIEEQDVPSGPWKRIVTTSPVR